MPRNRKRNNASGVKSDANTAPVAAPTGCVAINSSKEGEFQPIISASGSSKLAALPVSPTNGTAIAGAGGGEEDKASSATTPSPPRRRSNVHEAEEQEQQQSQQATPQQQLPHQHQRAATLGPRAATAAAAPTTRAAEDEIEFVDPVSAEKTRLLAVQKLKRQQMEEQAKLDAAAAADATASARHNSLSSLITQDLGSPPASDEDWEILPESATSLPMLQGDARRQGGGGGRAPPQPPLQRPQQQQQQQQQRRPVAAAAGRGRVQQPQPQQQRRAAAAASPATKPTQQQQQSSPPQAAQSQQQQHLPQAPKATWTPPATFEEATEAVFREVVDPIDKAAAAFAKMADKAVANLNSGTAGARMRAAPNWMGARVFRLW